MTKMTKKARARGSASWAVAEAKAQFSQLMERALTDGPQSITRNGKPTVVVVSDEEWQRKARRTGNLAEFFAASPLHRSGLKLVRVRGGLRPLE